MTKHTWDFCDFCETWMVRCGKCGNNSCNAGYGEIDGVQCDACPSAYEMQNQPITTDAIVNELRAMHAHQTAIWKAIETEHINSEVYWEDDDVRRIESRRSAREMQILEAAINRLETSSVSAEVGSATDAKA